MNSRFAGLAFGLSLTLAWGASAWAAQEGDYVRIRTTGHQTPNSCRFDAEQAPSLTRVSGLTPDGFNIDFVASFPDGEFTYASTPCLFHGLGNGFRCEYAEQITDFSFFGLNAVMRISGETWRGSWRNQARFGFVAARPAVASCVGDDCPMVASFFGEEFAWNCVIDPRGYDYQLK